MDPRFFLDLRVEPAVELALRPSSSAPCAPFSLSVEAASLVSGAWLAGLVSSTVFAGFGTLAAGVYSGAGGTLVVVGGAGAVDVGPSLEAAGLRGALAGGVGVVGETTLCSVSADISEGKPPMG